MPLLVILRHVTRQSSIRIVTAHQKQTCEINRLTSWVWNVLRQSYFLLQKLVDSQSVQGTISSWLHEWRHRLKNEFYFFGMETETDYFLLGFLFTDHTNFGDLKLFFSEDGYEMYKVLQGTCWAFTLPITAFVLPRPGFRHRRVFRTLEKAQHY